jgi:predicted enzyme related to lactoylglutathione lyase
MLLSSGEDKLLFFIKPGYLKNNCTSGIEFCCYWLFLVFILLVVGCSSANKLHTPPPTRTAADHYLIGKFVWHDLLTNNTAEAKRFYGGLFGWRFRAEKGVKENSLIINRGKVIGNIRLDIQDTRGKNNAIWLSSLSVSNVDEALAIVKGHGGEVFAGPAKLADRGRFAIVSDPQGALLMLLRAVGGDPVDTNPQAGDWLWMELWARDLHKAAKFYKALVAYQTVEKLDNVGKNIQRFKQNGVLRAGLVKLPLQQVKPNWLPYVRVLNVHQAVAKVQQLGGRIIIEPDSKTGQGNVAIIADPTGGVLAIQALKNK